MIKAMFPYRCWATTLNAFFRSEEASRVGAARPKPLLTALVGRADPI